MSQPAIVVENLGKEYQIGTRENGYKTFREAVTDLAVSPFKRFRTLSGNAGHTERFWALKDVSFEVQPGEVVGIIGRNGAGKSTLLKILSRITEPTEGRATINGRVGSLLEVGTGFHPELTGRENIYLNGSILGMSRQEISKKFDEIVDFSGVEKFLDTPVKRYSSGMKIRLGFAVAAHLEPEILIVDEVLAVGDSEFQKKCLGKMNDVATSGRTVLFVSHNMAAVSTLTSTCMLLNQGELQLKGATHSVIDHYYNFGSSLIAEWHRYKRDASKAAEIISVKAVNTDRQPCLSFCVEEEVTIQITVEITDADYYQIAYRLNRNIDGTTIFTTAMQDASGQQTQYFEKGMYEVDSSIPSQLLSPGQYHLLVAINKTKNSTSVRSVDVIDEILRIEIQEDNSLTLLDSRLGIISPLIFWKDVQAHIV